MKAKISKPDGTVIELEGTADEIAKVVGAPSVQFVPYQPYVPPTIDPYQPPTWPQIFYGYPSVTVTTSGIIS